MSLTSSKILLYLCLSFIGGVFLASFFSVSLVLLLGLLILGILFVSVFWGRNLPVVLGFCLLLSALGIWRYQEIYLRAETSKLTKYNGGKEAITLVGLIVKEPEIREKNIRLLVKVETARKDRVNQPVKGQVLVTTGRYREYRYGDRLWMRGKLKTPPIFKGFNYRDYLKKNGIYSLMYFPKIQLIKRSQGNPVYAGILSFKKNLRNSIYKNLPPPQSFLLEALNLGD